MVAGLKITLLAVVVAVPAAAAGTSNSRMPDLLPADCGHRLVQPDISRAQLVDNGNTTAYAYYGQFPWQARVVVYNRRSRKYEHQCGGIIVTRRHVLTASHCVNRLKLTSLRVLVGDLQFGTRDSNEQVFAVASFYVQRRVFRFGSGASLANDIALLQLKLRRGVGIKFGRFVQPACLPEADTKDLGPCTSFLSWDSGNPGPQNCDMPQDPGNPGLKILICSETLETQDLKSLIVARPWKQWKPRTLKFGYVAKPWKPRTQDLKIVMSRDFKSLDPTPLNTEFHVEHCAREFNR